MSTEFRKNITVASPSRAPAPIATTRITDEWPQLWFSARQQEWTSLVIVPAASDSAAALFVANALVDSARLYSENDVSLVNGIGAGYASAAEIVATLRASALRGDRSIIAVDCPLISHAAIHISRAADSAILLVPLGDVRVDGARKTVETIGEDRFIGSVTLRGGTGKRRKSRDT